jgi:hypothetical protein
MAALNKYRPLMVAVLLVLAPLLIILQFRRVLFNWQAGQQRADLRARLDAGKMALDALPRIRQLQKARDELRQQAKAKPYVPAAQVRIDDLTVSVEPLLKQLPNVVRVELRMKPAKPARRIVHFTDYKFVSADLFAADLKASLPNLTEANVATLYRKFLLEVECVQLEQKAALTALAKHHGLSRIVLEGLTSDTAEAYRQKLDRLKTVQAEELLKVRKQFNETRLLLKELEDKDKRDTEQYEQAKQSERQLEQRAEQHRREMLQVGVAGRLKLAELVDILPLDDDQHLPQALKVRQAAQVERLRGYGSFSLVILGASHDLTGELDDATEYVRVVTRTARENEGKE